MKYTFSKISHLDMTILREWLKYIYVEGNFLMTLCHFYMTLHFVIPAPTFVRVNSSGKPELMDS